MGMLIIIIIIDQRNTLLTKAAMTYLDIKKFLFKDNNEPLLFKFQQSPRTTLRASPESHNTLSPHTTLSDSVANADTTTMFGANPLDDADSQIVLDAAFRATSAGRTST